MNTNDTKVKQLIEKLNLKKKEVEKAEKPKWNTHLSFSFESNSSTRFNIGTVIDHSFLTEMASFILMKKDFFEKAKKELGTECKFSWLNHSAEEWLEDFKTRLSVIQISSKRKELNSLEEKLNALISSEEKRAIELEEISKILGE